MQLSEATGISPNIMRYKPSSAFVLPLNRIGIELELEGLRNRFTVKNNSYWETTNDGSLRGDGFELISKPVFGEDIIGALDQFEEELKRIGLRPAQSDRCSVHIHMECVDMNTQQLLAMMMLYAICEKAMFHYVGKNRVENIYCFPLCMQNDVALTIGTHLTKATKRRVQTLLSGYDKYNAVNLGALRRLGTVEFRHYGWYDDKESLIEWINIIMSLKKAALETDPDTILSTFSKHGAVPMLCNIFGDLYDKLDYEGIEFDTIRGMRTAQDIHLGWYTNEVDRAESHYSETSAASLWIERNSKKRNRVNQEEIAWNRPVPVLNAFEPPDEDDVPF